MCYAAKYGSSKGNVDLASLIIFREPKVLLRYSFKIYQGRSSDVLTPCVPCVSPPIQKSCSTKGMEQFSSKMIKQKISL